MIDTRVRADVAAILGCVQMQFASETTGEVVLELTLPPKQACDLALCIMRAVVGARAQMPVLK